MNIGEKIKFLRLQNKMSRKELSIKSGIAEISIRKYETGERNPKLDNIKKISKALNVPSYELIQNEDLDNTMSDFVISLATIHKYNKSTIDSFNDSDNFDYFKLFIDYLYTKFKNKMEILEKENRLSAINLINLYEETNTIIETKLDLLQSK